MHIHTYIQGDVECVQVCDAESSATPESLAPLARLSPCANLYIYIYFVCVSVGGRGSVCSSKPVYVCLHACGRLRFACAYNNA